VDQALAVFADVKNLLEQALASFDASVLADYALPQLIAVVGAYFAARLANRWLQGVRLRMRAQIARLQPAAARRLQPLEFAVVWLLLQWFALAALREADLQVPLVQAAVSLLIAWIAVRLGASMIASVFWSRVIAILFVLSAALKATGLWAPTLHILDEMALTVGAVRISVLGVIEATLIVGILWAVATTVGNWLDRWAAKLPDFTPSGRVLLGKTFRFATLSVAVIIALHAVGVDLTTLAVFSGAVGLGIGFGLQKVFSNLISGMILLLDRSVKPGDVIAVGGHYGWINALGARYVSVVTRDGIEHLIPNEDLISTRVENWSHSNKLLRLRVPFGVAYGSDLRQVMVLAEQAVREVDRVLPEHEPHCLLIAFADSSIDFELRFWINDPENGVHNVKSAVLMRLWTEFEAHGIEIPFPQQDVHLKTPASLPVHLVRPAPGAPDATGSGPGNG